MFNIFKIILKVILKNIKPDYFFLMHMRTQLLMRNMNFLFIFLFHLAFPLSRANRRLRFCSSGNATMLKKNISGLSTDNKIVSICNSELDKAAKMLAETSLNMIGIQEWKDLRFIRLKAARRPRQMSSRIGSIARRLKRTRRIIFNAIQIDHSN